MKEFNRDNVYFSLCGLNCALCSMYIGKYCPGCGCGEHHSCAIAKCSIKHNRVKYCYECDEFPCTSYKGIDEYDSFITHQNQISDIEKARSIGIDAYTQEQIEKEKILHDLLRDYNAGRQKSFYCLAVNLLDLQDLKNTMIELDSSPKIAGLTLKEKAKYAVSLFQTLADEKSVAIKLKKKPKAHN